MAQTRTAIYRLYAGHAIRPRPQWRASSDESDDMAVTGRDIGPWLIKTFGLPKYTIKFTMHSDFNEAVRIECEYYPDINTGETITKQFELVEVDAPRETNNIRGRGD